MELFLLLAGFAFERGVLPRLDLQEAHEVGDLYLHLLYLLVASLQLVHLGQLVFALLRLGGQKTDRVHELELEPRALDLQFLVHAYLLGQVLLAYAELFLQVAEELGDACPLALILDNFSVLLQEAIDL